MSTGHRPRVSVRSRNVPRASRTAAMKQPPCDGRRSSHRAALERSASPSSPSPPSSSSSPSDARSAWSSSQVVPSTSPRAMRAGAAVTSPRTTYPCRRSMRSAASRPPSPPDVDAWSGATMRTRPPGATAMDSSGPSTWSVILRPGPRAPSDGRFRPWVCVRSAVPTKRAKGEVPSSTSFRRM